jgi:catechol 2,3-dioxygenase-like lactoylglutathione lyase family enzyme
MVISERRAQGRRKRPLPSLQGHHALWLLAMDTLTCNDNFGYIFCMQMKLELVAVPVTDVDRAKAFYTEKIGFHADHDYQVRDDLRFVQLTPPGSACSIVIGVGITDMPPGSQKGLQMVVPDVKEVRDELVNRGVDVSDVEVMPWGSFVFFSDPDGNSWSLQQLPVRN